MSPLSPMTAKSVGNTTLPKAQESELPLQNAKEAYKRSEERLLSLEMSISALEAQIDLMVRLMLKSDSKVTHSEVLES